MTASDVHPMSQTVEEAQHWAKGVLRVAAHYRVAVSPEQVRVDLAWSGNKAQIETLARSAGLVAKEVPPDANDLSRLRLPLLAKFSDGTIGVIEGETEANVSIAFSADEGLVTTLAKRDVDGDIIKLFALRPAVAVADRRVDDYIAPWRPDWLRKIVLADLAPYRAVMVASLVTNVLALAGILFSMQVYDRVIPSQSMNTLYVLFGGVLIAVVFGLLMKVSRNQITDIAAREADLRVSQKVFGHALRVRNTARPRATGTFISQIRELEHVREIMASTTISALSDLPFFFMFCVLFYFIGGPLTWIPVIAMLLLVLPGLLAQKRLRQLAEASTRESSLRSAMLVETIQGLDDIKSMQAERRFENLWEHYTEVTSGASMKLRDLVGRLSAWAQTVQGGVFALVVFFGAPMVMAGDLSTGALVAASMLSSRMLAPLASVSQIINRWQQARVAREALDTLLALPIDTPEQSRLIHKPHIKGAFRVTDAVFSHNAQAPVLNVQSLQVEPGERIAILGRNGAGKSTLLSALAGLIEPIDGQVRVDDVSMGLIDPADIRRDICVLGQSARLFHGTLRENLSLGTPGVSDEAMISQLDDLGLAEFVQELPEGLDYLIQEGGLGLSGGQKQGLLLSRVLLRNPNVLLLDEPTAMLDEVAENAVINTLGSADRSKTLIVATHRPAVLRIIDRLIVVHKGQIAMDGPKGDVLGQLRGERTVA